jgi:hypothetical protein
MIFILRFGLWVKSCLILFVFASETILPLKSQIWCQRNELKLRWWWYHRCACRIDAYCLRWAMNYRPVEADDWIKWIFKIRLNLLLSAHIIDLKLQTWEIAFKHFYDGQEYPLDKLMKFYPLAAAISRR